MLLTEIFITYRIHNAAIAKQDLRSLLIWAVSNFPFVHDDFSAFRICSCLNLALWLMIFQLSLSAFV